MPSSHQNQGAWHPCTRTYENKNTKINSKGLTVNYTKICAYQNFPLYGIVETTPTELVGYDHITNHALQHKHQKYKTKHPKTTNHDDIKGRQQVYAEIGHFFL